MTNQALRITLRIVLGAGILFGLLVSTVRADDYIYDRPYGGKKIGKIDKNGIIYDRAYGGKKIGRVKKGIVYDRAYGGNKIGRVDKEGGAAYWLLKNGKRK